MKALQSSEFVTALKELRTEFPRPPDDAVAASRSEAPAPGEAPGNLPNASAVSEDCIFGKSAMGRDGLGAFKVQVHKEASLPESTGFSVLKLVLTRGTADAEPATGGNGAGETSNWHVWLENTGTKKTTVPVGTFVGMGGVGEFVSVTKRALTHEEASTAWRFTRITNHKKDTPTKADAALVFVQSLTAPCAAPQMQTLEDIEKTIGGNVLLYAHGLTRGNGKKVCVTPATTPISWVPHPVASDDTETEFGPSNLGQFIKSYEKIPDGEKQTKWKNFKGTCAQRSSSPWRQPLAARGAPLRCNRQPPRTRSHCASSRVESSS